MRVSKSLAKKVRIQRAGAVLTLPRSSYLTLARSDKRLPLRDYRHLHPVCLGVDDRHKKTHSIEQSGEKQGVGHNQPFKRESYHLKQRLMEKKRV
jgi:hypothetical protein